MISSPVSTRPARAGLNATEWSLVAFLAAGLFFALELAFGSSAVFAGLVALYVLLVAGTVAVSGGFATIPGVFVTAFAMQHVIVSQTLKFWFSERPDERLAVPIVTMTVENLTLLGLLVGIWIARSIRLTRKGPLFPPVANLDSLRSLAIVGTGLMLVRQAIVILSGANATQAAGTAAGPVKQLTMIDTLAFAAVVGVAVVASGGRRFTNSFVWLAVAPTTFAGFLIGERLPTTLAVLAIVVAAWAFGFRFRLKHVAFAALAGYVFFEILSPFSLALRNKVKGKDFGTNLQFALATFVDVATHPGRFQEEDYESKMSRAREPGKRDVPYFAHGSGSTTNVFERFSLVKTDDIIIQDTLRNGTTGWTTVAPAFSLLLPSSLGFQKGLITGTGNHLAHRVDFLVGANDYATGITTGFVCDAFSTYGYLGALLLPMAMGAVFFSALGFIANLSLRNNVFAIALTIGQVWGFTENTIGGNTAGAIYAGALATLAFLVVTRLALLVDFRYLRPRAVPEFEPVEASLA